MIPNDDIRRQDNHGNINHVIKDLEDSFFSVKKRDLYKYVVEVIERPLIERVLERTFGNQIKAAKILGINRNTLRMKIKKLGINVDKWKF